MDIRQLRYFLAIANSGQISIAAKKLHMSQPPLSQQIRQMENELGVMLFERKRNGRRIELTNAGKILYDKAENFLNSFDETLLEVREAGEGIRGTISIGTVLSCVSHLPEKIKSFNKHYPNVSFKLFGSDQSDLSLLLENRTIDLAIVRLPLQMENLSVVPLTKEPYVFVISKDTKGFTSKDFISIKEIENFPLLLIHRIKGEGIYERILKEFQRHDVEPNILVECPDVNILLTLITEGIGGSILPKSSVPPILLKEVQVLDIIDIPLQSETVLVYLKERYLSKAAQRFIELF